MPAYVTPPQVRSIGGTASGAGAITPAVPSNTIAGDLLIMMIETQGGQAATMTSGTWTEVPTVSPVVQGNTSLTAFYKIAESTTPAMDVNDSGNHQLARTICFKVGTFDPDSIFNTSSSGTDSATTSVSIPGLTTTRNFCAILAMATGSDPDAASTTEFGSPTNASLSSLTEQWDNTSAAGDGGAIYGVTGVMDTAGAVSATTCTAVTSAERSYMCLAINPYGGPVVRAVGAVATNTIAVSPGLPAGTVAGDLLIMVCDSTNGQAVTASGWSALPGGDSPVDSSAARLTILYKIAAGGDATTTNDSGDHTGARIIGIVAGSFDASTPFGDTAQGTQTATTSISGPTLTTTRDKSLVFLATASDLPDASSTTEYSAWANSDLAWVQEFVDNTATSGTGASYGCAGGIDTTAGSVGATTATAANSGTRANIAFAVQAVASATAYEIDAQPGSFAITGAVAGFPWEHVLNAQPGSFAVTGADLTVTRALVLNASPGSFALTGADLTSTRALVFNAEPGSFAITGAAATFPWEHVLNAQPGSFALTGADLTPGVGYTLNAQPGSFAISGAALTTIRALTLNAQPGVYVVTGANATLIGPVRFIPEAEGEIVVIVAEADITVLAAEGDVIVIPTLGEITAISGEEG